MVSEYNTKHARSPVTQTNQLKRRTDFKVCFKPQHCSRRKHETPRDNWATKIREYRPIASRNWRPQFSRCLYGQYLLCNVAVFNTSNMPSIFNLHRTFTATLRSCGIKRVSEGELVDVSFHSIAYNTIVYMT